MPASRFWTLQAIETAIFLALAAALTGFCFWWLRRLVVNAVRRPAVEPAGAPLDSAVGRDQVLRERDQAVRGRDVDRLAALGLDLVDERAELVVLDVVAAVVVLVERVLELGRQRVAGAVLVDQALVAGAGDVAQQAGRRGVQLEGARACRSRCRGCRPPPP